MNFNLFGSNSPQLAAGKFIPQKGYEQSGRRPALILSNDILNHHSSLAFVCPITNINKKHPFHIELDERTQTTGVILCDQAKMLDVGARNAQFKEECLEDLWNEAKELIISFMQETGNCKLFKAFGEYISGCFYFVRRKKSNTK